MFRRLFEQKHGFFRRVTSTVEDAERPAMPTSSPSPFARSAPDARHTSAEIRAEEEVLARLDRIQSSPGDGHPTKSIEKIQTSASKATDWARGTGPALAQSAPHLQSDSPRASPSSDHEGSGLLGQIEVASATPHNVDIPHSPRRLNPMSSKFS